VLVLVALGVTAGVAAGVGVDVAVDVGEVVATGVVIGVGVLVGVAGGDEGVGVGLVHVGLGVGFPLGVDVHVGAGCHLGFGFCAGWLRPPPWLLTPAANALVWAADSVVACAAVLVRINAAAPTAKQPDSTRMRIPISRSLSLDRSLTGHIWFKQSRSIARYNAAKRYCR
jgi:hypothetical protein